MKDNLNFKRAAGGKFYDSVALVICFVGAGVWVTGMVVNMWVAIAGLLAAVLAGIYYTADKG
jgi:hypothetical protein